MSAFGDSESDSKSVKEIIIEEEDWGDDVSILSRYESPAVTTIIIKFVLALIFIGACTGALIYSILNSESGETVHYVLTDTFPINTDQYCFNGSLIMQYRTGDDLGQPTGYTNSTYSCAWAQDDSKKRVYHRVGLTSKDWQFTYFVFENFTFFQTKKRCVQLPLGYADFLSDFGLEYIRKNREEQLMVNNRYYDVGVYEGEPPQDTIINGNHPSLIRGFASAETPVTYGWELFFDHRSNISLFKQEYWFPTMVHGFPNYSVFELPEECMQ